MSKDVAISKNTHCALIRGMLIQLAAATATKGTIRPIIGGIVWKKIRESSSKFLILLKIIPLPNY